MNIGHVIFDCFIIVISVHGAVIPADEDIEEQGLYSKSNHVVILTDKNFEKKILHQKHAILLQFYNSYCGHCRAFAPKFKNLAFEVVPWNNIIKLAVLDCSVEENNQMCRQYEVMAYPSLRYIHEHFSAGELGDNIPAGESVEKLKAELIHKLQTEQSRGRLSFAPKLNISSYDSYEAALSNIPSGVTHTFLIFEKENSTIGSEIALDINDYHGVTVIRSLDSSELAHIAGVKNFPGILAIKSFQERTVLSPQADSTKPQLLKAINTYLKAQSYVFPVRDSISEDLSLDEQQESSDNLYDDTVYYIDLEKTIKTSLHTEITRFKLLNGEPLRALLEFLAVLIISFPFKHNLQEYVAELSDTLSTKSEWSGTEVYDLVKNLELKHAPVYSPQLEYIGCKGSQPKYRGYTCGLWTLFHTLTVNAANKPGTEGPRILQAMHGYIKNFFGCTDCAQHFQAMAARNRLFEVKDNDKAVLWLWISHNEVNLRLAGDVTEDPKHPKIQFPLVSKCPECRLARGAWNLSAVYQYLQKVYSAENIQFGTSRFNKSAVSASSPFTTLDIGMLSLLYILSFVILLLVIKYFLTKHFYRKRFYKHGRGKV